MQTHGTQLMINPNFIKEKATNPNHLLEENPFRQAALLFFCREDTEEEELLS
jgi:hypothetical protein